MTYLLPCPSCQKSIPVEVVQAGDVLRCECGAEVSVPTLREIRRLPTPAESQPDEAPAGRAAWSTLQRCLFALGFLCTASSAAVAIYYSIAAAQITFEEDASMDQRAGQQIIDALTAEGAYKAWKMLQVQGIGDQQKPEYVINQEKKEEYLQRFHVALYVLAAGVLVMGVGVFVAGPRLRPAA